MSTDFLYPTLLTTVKSIHVDASDLEHAMDQALRRFRKTYPIVWSNSNRDVVNPNTDNYIKFDNGEQCTLELAVGTITHDVANYDFCVDIKLLFTYYSTEYLTANEIILIFQELFPDLEFDRWKNSYHIETFHI